MSGDIREIEVVFDHADDDPTGLDAMVQREFARELRRQSKEEGQPVPQVQFLSFDDIDPPRRYNHGMLSDHGWRFRVMVVYRRIDQPSTTTSAAD